MVVTIPVLLVGLMLAQAPISAVDAPPSLQQQADPSQPQDRKPDGAQEKKTDEAQDNKPPTPPHTGVHALFAGFKEDVRHLPSKENLYIAAVGGALALAVHPADATFNARLQSHSDFVTDVYAPGKYLGGTAEQVALSIGTYAFGRIFDKPKVSHLGMDLLRTQMLTELLVEPIKFATHRERPDGSDHQSFPSGHAAITFAAATVIERHLGWKNAALAYAIASYVAASRLHDNVHYLSDVVFGAAVGTIAGRTVTEHGREMWTFSPTPVQGGVAIMVTRAPH
jgi:membrane-associated phospholipid phosphatase